MLASMEAHHEYVAGDMTFEAFVAAGSPERRCPCVLIAHAWDGPNPILHDLARAIARQGRVGIAIDVYGKGNRGAVDGDNTHLMAPLLADRGVLRGRLLAAHAFARSLPIVDPERIASFGPCFGGLCALDLARASPPGLVAAIALHAPLTAPPGSAGAIAARVLVLHGWEDPTAPADDVVALARELTSAGADWELHAFGHAMHAFSFAGANAPERGVLYDPRAAARAQRLIASFLDEVLPIDPRGSSAPS